MLTDLNTAYDLFNNGHYKKSFLKLITISNQYSHHLDYLQLMSEVQCRLGDYIAQAKTLNVIRNKTQSFDDNMSYVLNQIKLGNDYEALSVLNHLKENNSNIFQLQVIYRSIMNIQIAINDFSGLKKSIEFYEHHGLEDDLSCYSKAIVHLNDNRMEAALHHIRKSIEINDKNDSSWVTLAMVHRCMGDHELAIANLERALDINKYNATAVKYYSQWTSQAGDLDRACTKINFYLSKHNFDEEMTENHISLLEKSGRSDLAETEKLKLEHYFA